MSEPVPTTNPEEPSAGRASIRWLRWTVRGLAVLALLAAGAVLFLQSNAFREMMRARLIAALEQSTGARVELREFRLDWPRLEVALRGLVLRGREAPEEPPLFSAEWLSARWRLISFWTLEADLEQVRVLEPKFYIVVDAAGRSNLPRPPRPATADGRWAERIVGLQIGRMEALRGELRWNQQRLPLDVRAAQVQLRLDYEPAADRYAGRFDFRDAVIVSAGALPLPSEGRLRFLLYADRAEVETFEWRTPRSLAKLRGAVRDFRSPRAEFQYEMELDYGEMGAFLGRRGWVGRATLEGNARFGSGDGWLLEGNLLAQTRRNGIAGWSEIPWTARGRWRLGRPRQDGGSPAWEASLTNLTVATLGGELAGEAVVRDTAQGPETMLRFDAHRLSFTALTEAMTALPVRLASLRWVGMMSGPLRAQFLGMGRELKVEADWEVAAVPVVPPGYLPISGKLKGSYDASRQRLESDGSYIDLPGTRLRGEGWFDPNDSQMRLVMDTRRLPDIDTLSQLVWREFPRLPLRLGGGASAEAEWTGGIRQARLAGNFRVRDFAYQNSSWDQFTGRLEYRRLPGVGEAAEAAAAGAPTVAATLTIRSGELSKATAQISFDLQLGLGAGGHGSHSPFTVRGRIRNTPLEELQRLAGTDYPLRGVVQGSFEASGTRQNPAGRGSLTVSDGTLYEEPFERLNAVLRLDGGGVWTAESIRAEKSGGFVHGSGAFHQRTRQLQFDLTGSGISLASFRTLQRASKRLTGIAEGRLSGSGDIKRPRLRGEIRLREFGFGLAEPGNLTLDMESRDGSAHWTVVGQMWNGQVQASGDTRLEEPFPTAAEIDFQNLDLPPLLRAFREPPRDLAGRFSGKARLQGNAQNWGGITLRGELAELAGSFRQVQVRSRGPVPFRYENRRIYLEQLHLAGPGAELEAAGAIVLAADPALHLTAQGRMDLAGLSPEDSDLALAGQVQLDAQIGGTIRQPLWRGRLFVTDASVHYGDFPNGLDHINGRVVFEGARGVLEDMTAESGSGQVQLSGFVRYGGVEGWQFQLTAEGTSIRVRYPEGLSTWVNGSVNWTGSLQSSLLEGRIVLTRQSVSPQFDLVPVLLRGREEPAPADLPEVLRNLRLSLEVTSAAELRLDTLTTRNLQTDVALRMQGTVAQPAWLGRIGILGGEILFAGKRYNVNRGEISFVNPFRFEPILSLSVQARVQRYDIAMDFSGPPDRLTVTYRSDPPLPTSDILALLVAGRARETSLETSPNQPLPEVSADALLSQALQSQIGSRLDRLFGSGRVRLDPQISGLGRSANASVALEQQLGEDISVLYITDVTSTQQQTIQAEWNISPKLSVVAIRDQNGLIGVNFQITLRFR